MANRSQIYVRVKLASHSFLIARHYRNNGGHHTVSRARHAIQWLLRYMNESKHPSEKEIKAKLVRVLDTDFDCVDCQFSSCLLTEWAAEFVNEPFREYIFCNCNNDAGKLFLDVDITNKTVKYVLLNRLANPDDVIMDAQSYMAWEYQTGTTWDTHLSAEEREYTADNIAFIERHAELMTRDEVEDFLSCENRVKLEERNDGPKSIILDNTLIAEVERNAEGLMDFNIWEPDEEGDRGNLYSGGVLPETIRNADQGIDWVVQHYSRDALMHSAHMTMHSRKMDCARELIRDFCDSEYGPELEQNEMIQNDMRIPIAYTTTECDERFGIQVYVDLEKNSIDTCITLPSEKEEEICVSTRQYESLEELVVNELETLDFDSLIQVSENEWANFSAQKDAQAALMNSYPIGSKVKWCTSIFENVPSLDMEGETVAAVQERTIEATVTGMTRNGHIILQTETGEEIQALFGYDDFYPVVEESAPKKKYYCIEDQIDDCYAFLEWVRKPADEMTDAEIEEAQVELEKFFRWEEHPGCHQLVPVHIASGVNIFDLPAKEE